MQTEEAYQAEAEAQVKQQGSFLEVLGVFAKLGISSFGGPIAHLGYFRQEIVAVSGWMNLAIQT
jgi:chromate transporter